MSNTAEDQVQWGRVLICGGTDWSKLGRKEPISEDRPDLLEPHILRATSNVRVKSIHAGCASCHFVVLSVEGTAFLFGRNQSNSMGVNEPVVSENAPLKLTVDELSGATPGDRFVQAACGRHHTLLVTEQGYVYVAGGNNFGQCGVPACHTVNTFTKIPVFGNSEGKEKAIKAAAGVSFSLVLTESGKVYAFGSGEHGQLGNGRTGEHIITGGKTGFDVEDEPLLVQFENSSKIVSIAAGNQHSVALDSEGLVFVWGYNGYCRLGLGNQVDILKPKIVPQFSGPNKLLMGAYIAAGPSHTVVIDRNGMLWLAGKWKNTGDGSSGSPFSTFRYLQEIQACKIQQAFHGGVTHFALTPDDRDSPEAQGRLMVVCWGQAAVNGELGIGSMTKSQTKPDRHKPLLDIDVFSIAPGQNTTLFLARPASEGPWTELPRHPIELPDVPEACVVCQEARDETLECEKCDNPYHLECLTPPLSEVPEGEWFCPHCSNEEGGPVGHDVPPKKGGSGKKRPHGDIEEDPERKRSRTGANGKRGGKH